MVYSASSCVPARTKPSATRLMDSARALLGGPANCAKTVSRTPIYILQLKCGILRQTKYYHASIEENKIHFFAI